MSARGSDGSPAQMEGEGTKVGGAPTKAQISPQQQQQQQWQPYQQGGQQMTPSQYQMAPQGMYGQPMRGQPMMAQPMRGQPMMMVPMPMQPPAPIPGCPPGLESLYHVEALSIAQEVELLEAIFDFETNNRYSIFNPFGMRVFFAGENTECCTRCCLGSRRPFLLHIYDAFGQPILDLQRDCSFAMCYFGPRCYGSDVQVSLRTTGELLGTVAQDFSCLTPSFSVLDPAGNKVVRIEGPTCGSCCACVMCGDAQFNILDVQSGEAIGSILKNFSIKEVFTDANNFGFRIRPDLDVKFKAVLLAAVFAIDFAYFEEGGSGGWLSNANNNNNSRALNGFECTITIIFTLVFCIVLYSITGMGPRI